MKTKTVLMHLSLSVSVITLAACGGGGGGGGGSAAAPAGGGVAGVAAKGILKGAEVSAYCGTSATALDTQTTDNSGKYKLTWASACSSPVKIVVKGKAGTKMEDEATGVDVDAPTVQLKAFVADTSTSTQSAPATVHVTPLTDMAAALIERAAAPTPAIVRGAEQAIISKVLSDNELAYRAEPIPVANVATADAAQRRLAETLTAISALAQTTNNACTAAAGTTGARVQCAIQLFEDQAKATIPTIASDGAYTFQQPTTGSTPSTMIAQTLTAIRTDPTAAGISAQASTTLVTAVQQSTYTEVVAPATPTTVESPTTQSGIYAARDLFQSLYNDLMSLTGTGSFLSTKLDAVNADWTAYGVGNGRGFINIFQALSRAADMAYEAKNGTWTANTDGSIQGDSSLVLVKDAGGAPLQYVRRFYDTDLQNAQNFMYCKVMASEKTLGKASCYYDLANFDITASAPSGAYHVVTVDETSTGHYTWNDYTDASVSSKKTGEAIVTRSSGAVTNVSLIGDIQPLASGMDHSALNVTASVNTTTAAQTYSLSGTVNTLNASSATKSSVSLSTGSQLVVTTGASSHTSSVTLVATITTPAFKFEGTLAMSNFTASVNGEYSPALSTFTGKVSTASSTTPTTWTEFLSGTIRVEMTNLATYDPRVTSDTNFIKERDTYSGTITVPAPTSTDANAVKTYKLTDFTIDNLSATSRSQGRQDVMLIYTNPSAKSINVSGTSYADATKSTLTVSGPGSVTVTMTAGKGDVMVNGAKVGTVDMKAALAQQIRLTDGTTTIYM